MLTVGALPPHTHSPTPTLTPRLLWSSTTQPSDLTYLTHEIKAPNPTLSSGGAATASARGLASTIRMGCVRFRPFEDVLCAGHRYTCLEILHLPRPC